MAPSNKKVEVEYVYGGAVLHRDEVVHSYIRLVDDELGDATLYKKALSKHVPGSILEFTALGTSDAIVEGSAKYVGMWGDAGLIAEWEAMTAALLASEKGYVEALAKKLNVLDPIRVAYSKLEPREQAVLLAQVAAYIAGED